MLKGFLSGAFWGGMVGALVLAVLSLYAPLPSPQVSAVGAGAQAPAATPAVESDAKEETSQIQPTETKAPEIKAEVQLDVVPKLDVVEDAPTADLQINIEDPETAETLQVAAKAPVSVDIDPADVVAAAEPSLDATPVDPTPVDVTAEIASGLEAPQLGATTDVDELKLPQITDPNVTAPTASGEIALAEVETTDRPLVITEKPFNTLPVAVLKTAPGALGFAQSNPTRTTVKVGVTSDQSPSTTTSTLAPPVIGELTPNPVENPAIVRVAVRPTARTVALPQIGDTTTLEATEVSADTPIGVPVEPITNPLVSNTANVVTGRLPSVGDVTSGSRNTFVSVDPDATDGGKNALKDHAAEYTTNGQSLFSIVIIDAGQSGVPREHLLNSSYPITVAIDPSTPAAANLMAQYQAAGIEVVALLNDLPTAAAPSDVAVALEGYFNVLNKSVAVMEPLDRRLQRDRDLLQPVLGSIAATGHGLVTYAQGLNATQQSAKRVGVPSAAIFRVLDGEGEKAPKIKRYLRRAAFNAGRDGSVVVVGRSYAETMTAILEWALENNDVTISLAPVSAILKVDLASES